MAQVITLQQIVITHMTGDQTALQNGLHPHYDMLLSTSSTVRRKSLAALTEQFQRLSQAAPPQRTLPSSQNEGSNCFGRSKSFGKYFTGFHACEYTMCRKCWWYTVSNSIPEIKTRDKQTVKPEIFLQRFHYRRFNTAMAYEPYNFRCFICRDKPLFPDEISMANHVRQHTYNQIYA